MKNKEKRFSVYRTKIHKEEDLEEDAEANCFSYKSISYKNCTDSVLHKQYLEEVGCVPPWFTYDTNQVCNNIFSQAQWRNIPNMIFASFDQTAIKECKQPCIRLEYSTKTIRIVEPYNYRGLKILFNPTVEVAMSMPTISVLGLMSNIGGFLGLFLGFSILQLLLMFSRWLARVLPKVLKYI